MTLRSSAPVPLGRRAARVLAVGVAAATLGGVLAACAPLIVGGAMVGGTLMYTDRRTSGAQIEDQAIELKASRRIAELTGERVHVNVTSYNRLVLLTGEALTEADRATAGEAASRVENVRSVVNELAVMGHSSLTVRSNDSILSGKVKASLVDAKDLMANAFKVVTERGTVYLMGRVTEREANRAADIARSVSGVQKVVRVLEVISEAELAQIDPARRAAIPAAPPASTAR
ncbi:BON domain-containing protein [Piscinibacter sakaiensis]|uniref:21 kDa hemolysin n=1 Tax=Piscinibacter sakaiensis TaxID=1547922 RepID=A0A0K8NXC5_PISS1|nr:BON domain-containing protein [Piscinibacter sakaiensis]GAP35052.1 21 kDa hemolysin precursor [Piscinibacter sakaiensis]